MALAAGVLSGCAKAAEWKAARASAVITPASPGDYQRVLTVGRRLRSYLLHIPVGFSARRPTALVFVFHGYSENGRYIRAETGMDLIADLQGFLIVYPDGTASTGPLSWNAGGCCGYAMKNRVDESAFVRAILADLGGFASIDPRRIYATGFSNGALLSYRLACEMADAFAAVAPVAGTLSVSPCIPQEPVSVLHIHGSNDVSVPFRGGGVNPASGLAFPSVYRVIAAWVRNNGCQDSPRWDRTGLVMHTEYPDCRNGAAVELYLVMGMGHFWPTPGILPASRLIWEFFAAHPKP
ncbi:MAG: hypothetical protein JW929_06795 [Anaerolineales bacterium]|nr:hypothetical protein [Anaerolineales bacterium]